MKKLLGIIAVLVLSFGIGMGVNDTNLIDSSDPPSGGGFKLFPTDPTNPTEPTEPIENLG
jgi:hypothetical protein